MFISLVIVVHESLVNPLAHTNTLIFQHVCVFEPFPTDCMILRSILSHRGRLRDSYAAIKEELIHSLMLQKEKPCIKSLLKLLNLKIRVNLTKFVFCETSSLASEGQY